jgi:hypothetical protein
LESSSDGTDRHADSPGSADATEVSAQVLGGIKRADPTQGLGAEQHATPRTLLGDWRVRVAIAGAAFAGFIVGLLAFYKPWQLQPDLGDIPTWLAASFAAIAGWVGFGQLRTLREQVAKEEKRSQESEQLLREQLEEQRKATAAQAVVLEAQTVDLREAFKERQREAEERRRSQAAGVTAWLADHEHPLGGRRLLAAVLSNQSDQPIYDVQANLWYMEERRLGTEWTPTVGGGSMVIKIVTPHADLQVGINERARPYPEEDDERAFAASIIFTDAARNRWERTPSGALNQVSPDMAYPFGDIGSGG